MDINRKRRDYRHVGKMIDMFNIGIAVIIIVAAIMLAIDFEKNMIMIPVVFSAAVVMNCLKGFKVYKMRETAHAFILWGVAVAMLSLTIVAFMVIL